MKNTLNYLFAQNKLTKEEAKAIMTRIGKGEFSESEIASFLTVYLMREITPAELSGFREAFLDLCIPVDLSEYNTIDVCGTGGDEKNTFNISTSAAFVMASLGIKVVKHGNYGVSSSCGSSNVLESLGYKFSNDQSKIRREIEETNICYLHAPFFHPAMKNVAPVRKNLKVKTFFNLLGPMVNPCRPQNQIVGVYNQEVQELYNNVYKDLDINYFILYSLDGYDEISLTDNFRAISKTEDKIWKVDELGFKTVKQEDLYGGDTVEDSAKIFTSVLEGKGTPAQMQAVTANAAFGIKCVYPEKSISDCIAMSKEALESGKALQTFHKVLDLQK